MLGDGPPPSSTSFDEEMVEFSILAQRIPYCDVGRLPYGLFKRYPLPIAQGRNRGKLTPMGMGIPSHCSTDHDFNAATTIPTTQPLIPKVMPHTIAPNAGMPYEPPTMAPTSEPEREPQSKPRPPPFSVRPLPPPIDQPMALNQRVDSLFALKSGKRAKGIAPPIAPPNHPPGELNSRRRPREISRCATEERGIDIV